MKVDFEKRKQKHILLFIFVIASLAAAIGKLLVGFDIDEAYAVVLPYRFLQGDHLFTDMWEVHQTSAFLPGLLIWAFVKVTGENTGLVLFLRAAASLVHLFFALLVYRRGSHYFGKTFGIFLALLYYNFLPKWMMNFDFSMQQLWFFTACLELLWIGLYGKRKIALLFSGMVLAFGVLSYPGLVFAYPCILLGIWMLTEQETTGRENKSKFNNCLLLTGGCAIIAVVFFGYLRTYMSFSQLLESIPMVFSDGSHQYDLMTKLWVYLRQWAEILVQSVILLVPTAVGTWIARWFLKRRGQMYLSVLSLFTAIFLFLSSAIVVFANVLGISWGPFRLQVRYLLFFVLGFFLYREIKRQAAMLPEHQALFRYAKGIFWMLLIPSAGNFAGVLLASNVGPASSASYLVIGNIACVILLWLTVSLAALKAEQQEKGDLVEHSIKGVLLLFCLSLILCKGYYVRVTEYAPGNVLQERVCISQGAAKGIWVYPQDAQRMMGMYQVIEENAQSGERILFMGTEALNNLTSVGEDILFVSPTTISTPAFNQQWTAYFTQYKDKQPDVIFIAKNTVDNREKFFAQNDFGKWIAQHYNVEEMIDTEYLCIIRK